MIATTQAMAISDNSFACCSPRTQAVAFFAHDPPTRSSTSRCKSCGLRKMPKTSCKNLSHWPLFISRLSTGLHGFTTSVGNCCKRTFRHLMSKTKTLNPEPLYSQKEHHGMLRKAVNRLSPTRLRVVALRELDERSLEKTFRTMRISNAAVKSRLYRARRRLRSLLDARKPHPVYENDPLRPNRKPPGSRVDKPPSVAQPRWTRPCSLRVSRKPDHEKVH